MRNSAFSVGSLVARTSFRISAICFSWLFSVAAGATVYATTGVVTTGFAGAVSSATASGSKI